VAENIGEAIAKLDAALGRVREEDGLVGRGGESDEWRISAASWGRPDPRNRFPFIVRPEGRSGFEWSGRRVRATGRNRGAGALHRLGAAPASGASHGVSNLLGYANKGTEFLFGASATNPLANTFALGALPVIIFFAALVSILYYLGDHAAIVRWVGGGIGWITGIGRVEALGSAANIFVGQSESPLVVRPYLAALTPAQLFTLMTVGMAGVAGTILAAYASLLGSQYLPFLLAAAFMSAPGGILMAKIMMPDTIEPANRRRSSYRRDGSAARARPPCSPKRIRGAPTRSRSPRRSRKGSGPPTSSWRRGRARRPG
jgi:hypothetical protein